MESCTDSAMVSSKYVTKRKKGGLKTMPCIMANEGFERVASVGLQVNMIFYLKGQYHFDSATGANILFWWGAISNFMPTLGAFVSDSYLGRFHVIAIGSLVSLIGQTALLLTAIFPEARPPHCENYPHNCAKPNSGHLMFLFSAFTLMAIGAGGVRPCSVAFGADQFDDPNNPKNERILQSFFNWYYASVATAVIIALIIIAYIQNHYGWIVGFGVSVALMLLSTIMFFIGTKLYVKIKGDKSLLTGFAQVIAIAWRNKHLPLPPMDSDAEYYHNKDSKLIHPSKRLRFLNKACMVRDDPGKGLNPDGAISDPWKACTIEQVENLKALINVLPTWSTSIMIAVTISQHAFPILQANTMDRRVYRNFKIPPASLIAFAVVTMAIWVTIYDRLLVPRLSKYTKNPRGLSFEQRIGIGLFISCIATGVSALVEGSRRSAAIKQGLAGEAFGVVKMSVFRLVPQYCLGGLAEAFNAIGQIEYYYSCFPKRMASIGVSLFALGLAVGNLVGSLILTVVDRVSKRGGHISWVADNLNQGHYDYYYWVLCILSLINFIYFVLLNLLSNSCKNGDLNINDGGEGFKEKEEEDNGNKV